MTCLRAPHTTDGVVCVSDKGGKSCKESTVDVVCEDGIDVDVDEDATSDAYESGVDDVVSSDDKVLDDDECTRVVERVG